VFAIKASKVRMTVLALLATTLAAPAGSAVFMGTNAAVYAPTVAAGLASLNWAGYALYGAPAYTSVQGSWTVPAATCDSGQASMSGIWVGLGGFGPHPTGVEQIGTASNCDAKGSPSYFAWYELFPLPAVLIGPVSPGETINASVSFAAGTYTLQLNDFSQPIAATGDNTSAEWIAEAPATCTPDPGPPAHCRPLPLTDFSPVTFSGMNSTPFAGPMFQITMVTKSFTPKAVVAAPFDGSSFTVLRLHK
jgi:Peptidase A4 family